MTQGVAHMPGLSHGVRIVSDVAEDAFPPQIVDDQADATLAAAGASVRAVATPGGRADDRRTTR